MGGGTGWAGAVVILLPEAVRIYVATQPVSMRKSFEGLSNEVRSVLTADPLSGHVFLFLNKSRSQVRILMWTRGGFTIVAKRLERGRFTFPDRVLDGGSSVEIEGHELSMLLEGLEPASTRSAARWSPVAQLT
jgi:transposase